jgi:Icc-related predicted phosphoesterase
LVSGDGNVKILCFTDTHCDGRSVRALLDRASAPAIDAILCAGDYTWFGEGAPKVMGRLAQSGKPIYHVPGNHEDGGTLQWMRENVGRSFDVNGRWERLGGTFVCGFGGLHGPGERNDDRFAPYPELSALETNRPQEVAEGRTPFVFLTHYPPFGALDGSKNGPQGSVQVRRFIERVRPALVVCGHIHGWAGRSARIGKTLVVNPGPAGMVLDWKGRGTRGA